MSWKETARGDGSPEGKFYGKLGQKYYDRLNKDLYIKETGYPKKRTKTGWRRYG